MEERILNKKVHFYVNYNNMVVLQNYLDIIKAALEKNGFECDYVKDISELDKSDLYVFPMGIDAFKYYWKGYRRFILWQQGATADESFMRNHSKLRYNILNYMDCFAMKKAKLILYCSDYMRKHYEQLAHTDFHSKSYLMPCYNEKIEPEIIREKDYSKKVFTYVGSLDLWQCFDETVELYKKIEMKYPESVFRVLTFSVDEAKEKLSKAGIKNYDVKCVPKEEVKNELRDVVYGFLLRKESIVNRVATPTKLSSYLSVGIIPIFSTVLDDFERVSKKMEYVIPVSTEIAEQDLFCKLEKKIDKNKLYLEYEKLFWEYYGTDLHVKNIAEMIIGIF